MRGGEETETLAQGTSTHKTGSYLIRFPSLFQLIFSPIFSSLTIGLLIESSFSCYEADGGVRRGMQKPPEGGEDREEKGQKGSETVHANQEREGGQKETKNKRDNV